MKSKGLTVLLLLVAGFLLIPVQLNAASETRNDQTVKKTPTELYYFHLSRRCMTCQTVEKVAEQSVQELYPDAFKNGDITFKSINIEDKENKALIKRLKINGQCLLIVNGQERFDITDKGFLYAVKEPEKLKSEMKSILDKFVK